MLECCLHSLRPGAVWRVIPVLLHRQPYILGTRKAVPLAQARLLPLLQSRHSSRVAQELLPGSQLIQLQHDPSHSPPLLPARSRACSAQPFPYAGRRPTACATSRNTPTDQNAPFFPHRPFQQARAWSLAFLMIYGHVGCSRRPPTDLAPHQALLNLSMSFKHRIAVAQHHSLPTCRTTNGSRVSKAINLLRLKSTLKSVPARARLRFKSISVKQPGLCKGGRPRYQVTRVAAVPISTCNTLGQ